MDTPNPEPQSYQPIEDGITATVIGHATVSVPNPPAAPPQEPEAIHNSLPCFMQQSPYKISRVQCPQNQTTSSEAVEQTLGKHTKYEEVTSSTGHTDPTPNHHGSPGPTNLQDHIDPTMGHTGLPGHINLQGHINPTTIPTGS